MTDVIGGGVCRLRFFCHSAAFEKREVDSLDLVSFSIQHGCLYTGLIQPASALATFDPR